jgi:hypothetical protein
VQASPQVAVVTQPPIAHVEPSLRASANDVQKSRNPRLANIMGMMGEKTATHNVLCEICVFLLITHTHTHTLRVDDNVGGAGKTKLFADTPEVVRKPVGGAPMEEGSVDWRIPFFSHLSLLTKSQSCSGS